MINVLITIAVFIAMEGATWIIHKYVMHGFLWFLHRDHHDHSNDGELEKKRLVFCDFRTAHYCVDVFRVIRKFQLFVFYRLGNYALRHGLFFCT